MTPLTTPSAAPLSVWPEALGRIVAQSTRWKEIVVLRETRSTQDHARQLRPGAVVVAWRQTHGRGRLGRSWIDTGEDGLAMSATIEDDRSGRASVIAGVAAAEAIDRACTQASHGALEVGLKWPNDLILSHRKLGGILVEAHSGCLTIGIGVNCAQQEFASPLGSTATSLAMHGVGIDRLDLAGELLRALERWLVENDDRVGEAYTRRDTLVGRHHRFSTPEGVVEGVVVRIDPAKGLVVRTSRGDLLLCASTTSLCAPDARS